MDHHINKACWIPTFRDEFDDLYLWGESGGVWKTSYQWGNDLVINNELQYYVDPREHDVDPFRIDDGVLIIEARPAPEDVRPDIDGRQYTSGLLTTEKSFTQRYGYFEVRAEVPAGKGLWPGFWMLPAIEYIPEGVQQSAEVDILEFLGHDPTTMYTTVHSNESGELQSTLFEHKTPDLTADFHTYGLFWSAENLIWYLDGNEVARTRTPADVHAPMYLQLNLAVGGDWPGQPDEHTIFPAEYRVDYVRVYRPMNAACAQEEQPHVDARGIDPGEAQSAEIVQNLAAIRGSVSNDSFVAEIGHAAASPREQLQLHGYVVDDGGN